MASNPVAEGDELGNLVTLPGSVRARNQPASAEALQTLGRYRLERKLGEGGMGVVHEAFDSDLQRRVAIKMLRSASSSPDGRERLLREARAMARLAHANIVTVYEVGTSGGRDYVVMELIAGETLADWLRSAKRRSVDVISAFLAAGRGLAAAHAAGIVHRDFKPHNVLRSREGRIVVTDFGLARDAQVDPPAQLEVTLPPSAHIIALTAGNVPRRSLGELTMTGMLLGTPAYMAPEQWTGGPVTPATDQFAFCVALWEALVGERPYDGLTLDDRTQAAPASGAPARELPRYGPTLEVLRAQVALGPNALDASRIPRRLRAVLRRGLDPDPARRWPDMDALLARTVRVGRRFGIVAAVALGAMVATALVLRSRAQIPVLEAANQRLEKAVACHCALARIQPALEVISIFQVDDPSEPDDPEKLPVVFPASKTKLTVEWIGREALLPLGSYVLEYRVRGAHATMMVRSQGLGYNFTIATPAPPEQRSDFRFVGGGACGIRGASVDAFLIADAIRDTDRGREWKAARDEAMYRHGRLPTSDEITCATKLGMFGDSAASWHWTISPRGQSHAVVKNGVERMGKPDGLAALRVVKSATSRHNDLTIRFRPAITETSDSSGTRITLKEYNRVPLEEDIATLLVALADTDGRFVVLEGDGCDKRTARDKLIGGGAPASSVFVSAGQQAANIVTARFVHTAPDRVSQRDNAEDTSCRTIVTETIVEDLGTVEFEPGASSPTIESLPTLQAIAATIRDNSSIQLLEVQGHVFSGRRTERLAVSLARAKRVRDLLIREGVLESRLTAQGYGDSQPVACSRELADLVSRHEPVTALRRAEGWSPVAESMYLLGGLDEYCRAGLSSNDRLSFLILKRTAPSSE